jgi:hypothetical protein
MAHEEQLKTVVDRMKSVYDIDIISMCLVKNQHTIYTAKTSLGPARIYIHNMCANITFTSSIVFDGQNLNLKKDGSNLQPIVDDINERSMVLNVVKLKTMGGKHIHFFEDTKFTLKFIVSYALKNPQIVFKAVPYPHYAKFVFLDEVDYPGCQKEFQISYIRDTFQSMYGFDQAFHFVHDYFKSKKMTMDDVVRLTALNDMVMI